MTNRFIGCAGWSIPAAYADRFPGEGSHLERYGRQLPAVEINSSFYRPHRPDTYRRWADSVPEEFRFAVKLPKVISHVRRLIDIQQELDRFVCEISALGDKRGPILVQLPPSLRFEAERCGAFFQTLRERFEGEVVCEPRHEAWFTPEGTEVLKRFQVARVAADPPRAPGGGEPGGGENLVYYRLHGAPKVYSSDYTSEQLRALAKSIREIPGTTPVWCIFDNTAEGSATGNALALQDQLHRRENE